MILHCDVGSNDQNVHLPRGEVYIAFNALRPVQIRERTCISNHVECLIVLSRPRSGVCEVVRRDDCYSRYWLYGDAAKTAEFHTRCNKTELTITSAHVALRFRAILLFRKLRRLGTPISSQSPLLCALSTSDLVGATSSCAQ